MAKYKITNIDEEKGLVTFQVLNKTGAILLTDTRSDLPIEDKDAVDVIVTAFSKLVAQDAKQSRKADAKLLAIVNQAQTVDEV